MGETPRVSAGVQAWPAASSSSGEGSVEDMLSEGQELVLLHSSMAFLRALSSAPTSGDPPSWEEGEAGGETASGVPWKEL